MNAPLSRYLTSFATKPVPHLKEHDVQAVAIDVMEPVDETQESELDIAVREARREVEDRRDLEVAALIDAHSSALAAALDVARSGWAQDEGLALASRLDAALQDLKAALASRIADVLRPLLVEAVVARTVDALGETIDRILADPDHPCLTVRGPQDLLDALRSRRSGEDGMTFEASDGVDVVVTGDGTRIETRLGRAIASLSNVESDS